MRCEISSDLSNLNLVLILEAYLLAAPAHLEILRGQRQFLLRLKSINDTLELHQSRSFTLFRIQDALYPKPYSSPIRQKTRWLPAFHQLLYEILQ